MKINEKKGIERFYRRKLAVRLFAFVCGLLTAILFSVALVRDFLPDRQIFEIGARLFYDTVYISLGMMLVCFLFCAFAIPKEKKDPDSRLADAPEGYEFIEYHRLDNPIMKFFRYACAVLLFAQGAVRVYLFVTGNLLLDPAFFITTLTVFLIFPLVIYFVPELAQILAGGNKKAHLGFGTVGLFWFVLMVIYHYYDRTVVLSSPYKLMYLIMLIITLLALTEEIRYQTSLPAIRARLATLCSAFIATFGFSVSRAVMLICGKSVSLEDTVSVFIGLAFALYFGARLVFYDEY